MSCCEGQDCPNWCDYVGRGKNCAYQQIIVTGLLVVSGVLARQHCEEEIPDFTVHCERFVSLQESIDKSERHTA